MATSNPLSQDLTCAICLELYINPRVLRCMHTYCHECMVGLFETKTIRNASTTLIACPECRKETILDERGVEGLPVNIVLSKVVETYRSTSHVPCSICEEPTRFAVKTCIDCPKISYCGECLRLFHPQRGVLKTHKLVEPSAAEHISNNSSKHASDSERNICQTLTKAKFPSIASLSSKFTSGSTAIAFITVRPAPAARYYLARCENAEAPQQTAEEVVITRWSASSNSCQIEGLRFNTRYFVSVAAQYEDGTSTYSKQEILLTRPRVNCDAFLLAAEDKHSDLELSCDCSSVAHTDNDKLTVDDCYEAREWDENIGIAADRFFTDGCYYWEVEIAYKVKRRLDNDEIFTCFGICEERKFRDKYPLSHDFSCVCVVIFKLPDSSQVGVRVWNGPDRMDLPSSVLLPLNRRPARLRFGIFLNMDAKVLKILHLEADFVLETVSNLRIDQALPICSVGDPHVIEVKLEFFTGPQLKVPSIVQD